MRVLVTGGTGFIGSHLVRALVQRDHEVTLLTRATSDAWRLTDVRTKVTLVPIALEDRLSLDRVIEEARPEMVYHLGMPTGLRRSSDLETTTEYLRYNLNVLMSLVQALNALPQRPRALVRTGSIAEYGFGDAVWKEFDAERPSSAYGAALLSGTRFLSAITDTNAVPVRTARPALTYGPAQSNDFFVPSAIETLLAGRPLNVERPEDRRDYIHVDDVARGLMRYGSLPDAPAVLNLSTGTSISSKDLALEIAKQIGASPDLISFGEQDHANCLAADATLAQSTFSWEPKTTLASGLTGTIDWFKAQRKTAKPMSISL